ncbi:MAG: calcium-binding protein, partial [Octadecabacter sp.]
MAVYTVGFYASDPSGIFSNTVGNTFTWTGSSTATGQATITDNEAGVEGTTLDDDNNGGETATADVTIGGNTSTSTTVDAELVWTIQDTVTGETFEVAQFDVENGAASGRYTLSEVPLVAGRTYETLAYNSNPDVTAGDIAFSATDYVAPDGIVTGTDSDDVIDSSYTADTDGDVIDDGISNGASGNDDSIEALGGNDIIDAGAGDDTIDGGTGADTIEGGQGADSILGGTGEDTIYGDSNGTVEGNTSTFEWDGQGIADETSVTGGVTGTTVSGDIQVAMSVTQEANFTGASMETNDPLYDYNDLSDTSSIELFGGSAGTDQNAATMTLDFSSTDATSFEDEVTNVTFGIFDIDELVGQFLDQVVITAYDADGNPVVVTLTAGDSSTLNVDNTTGTATAIGGSGGAGSTDSQTGFLEVFVAGPVSQIVIDYNNVDTAYGNHAIRIGDIELTSIPATDPTLNGDNISGGDDDDTIYAGEGDDTAAGDAGNDTIYGEDGDDTL